MSSSSPSEDGAAGPGVTPKPGVPRGGVGRPAYAAAWCPDARLQAVVNRVHTREEPIALVDDSRRQSILLCANESASRQGVEAGMRTVQALARCSRLRIERPSPAAEARMGRLLLETALAWAPGVEETETGWLTLDLSTQPNEERGESARRFRGRLYDRGVEAVVGLGETPSLARLAALAARHEGDGVRELGEDDRADQLERLPVALGEIEDELGERLRLWGIESLGAFARLRREAVASRLGEEGVALWLRLNGRVCRPLRLTSLEELFECAHEFDHEVREREPLLFVVNRFLDELIVRVGNTGRAVAAVHILLTHTDGSCQARRFRLPEPLLEHEPLFHLVGGYLERLEAKGPVESLRLRCEPTDPVATQRGLFGTGLKNAHRLGETMGRLRGLVGSDRVGSPRHRDTHRPGEFDLVPLPGEIEPARERGGPPVTGAVYRRFRSAPRVEVEFREGEPARIRSHRLGGAVVDRSGPWPRQGDWWHRGRGWDRVEWDVALRGGGLYRLVGTADEWVVEGQYG